MHQHSFGGLTLSAHRVRLLRPLTVNFKWAHSNILHVHGSLTYISAKGLLPDCSVGAKDSENEDDSTWMRRQHARQLSDKSMLWIWLSHCRMTIEMGCEWQTTNLLQVSAWHDRSYTAGIAPLAQGLFESLNVKSSPWPCSHSSPAGRICAILAQARPKMIQPLISPSPGGRGDVRPLLN